MSQKSAAFITDKNHVTREWDIDWNPICVPDCPACVRQKALSHAAGWLSKNLESYYTASKKLLSTQSHVESLADYADSLAAILRDVQETLTAPSPTDDDSAASQTMLEALTAGGYDWHATRLSSLLTRLNSQSETPASG